MSDFRSTARRFALLALTIACGAARAAASYAVHELPVEAPPGAVTYQAPRSIDAQGRVLVNVQVIGDGESFFLSERCRIGHCRTLTSRQRSTLWQAMNDAGATAGEVWRGDTPWAARRVPGQGVDFLTVGSANDVNLANVAVGRTQDWRPFVHDTSLHLLPTPGGAGVGEATAINDRGVVAGWFRTANGDGHPFIHANGVSTDLTPGAPRYADAVVSDINNAGAAVGCAQERSTSPAQAVRFESGRVIYLGALVDGTRNGTCARAIDESGRLVVGDGEVDPLDVGQRHGFVHDGTALHDLNDLLRPEDAARYLIYRAMDVNDAGQISAHAIRRSDGQWLAVRLDPRP